MNGLHFLVGNEAALRLSWFLLVLVLLGVAERTWPLRGDARPARRQLSNLTLMAIDTVLLRLGFPLLAVGVAMQVRSHGGGLFNALSWPLWVEIPLGVLILDAAIYWQHRLLHRIPLLWRIHRVHHSDIALDVTTGVRFHPLEIGLSMAIKLAVVMALGLHPAAIVIFELLLSAASLFTHADFALRSRAERLLRSAIVTPSMHRIHHSVRREEIDSNYGFLLSLWDRLFRSYRASPAQAERSMSVGLPQWRRQEVLGLLPLLLQPFRRDPCTPEIDSTTKGASNA